MKNNFKRKYTTEEKIKYYTQCIEDFEADIEYCKQRIIALNNALIDKKWISGLKQIASENKEKARKKRA